MIEDKLLVGHFEGCAIYLHCPLGADRSAWARRGPAMAEMIKEAVPAGLEAVAGRKSEWSKRPSVKECPDG